MRGWLVFPYGFIAMLIEDMTVLVRTMPAKTVKGISSAMMKDCPLFFRTLTQFCFS